ncbi:MULTISPECIES: DUF2971 domain-containing protein [Psychrobacter]|uniref:DUF2971 domain-containing protein n=4 Tax=Moraxellaceae TaxID=468 RepID=UPI001919AC61|nr:DUF2971 domain-containing protein [Psychrobacter immobilis]|tara:strand:+ start:53 stop:1672 length:1620 start_codon:yes stop_codon:yes gene_type:complete
MNIDELNGLDEVTQKEVEKLLKVTREKNGDEEYISAQFELEDYMDKNKKYELGVKYLKNIREDDGAIYYKALILIFANQYFFMNDLDASYDSIVEFLEGSEYAFNGVKEDTFDSIRGDAFGVAKKYFYQENYIKSLNLFKLIGGSYSYQSSCYEKICKLKMNIETKKIGEMSNDLKGKVEKIIDILKLDFLPLSEDEQAPERKLAHYTSTYTTNKLLSKEKNKDKPSAFRLNTINNVNDPSEGKLLTNYLESVKENSFYKPDFDERLHAFISCFTFNHDSLNQFRLYGKEDNKEASGVSLVFNKDFFKENDSQSCMNNIFINRTIKNVKNNSDEGDSSAKRIEKQSVMRCVYIDPTSDYIHLAQRNRLTFFREFGRENLEGGSIPKAEIECIEYENYIDKKTEDFREAFIELKSIYNDAIDKKKSLKKLSKEDSDKIDSLLDMIILPLKYLVKHSAFQEEQECRMVYITSLDDPKVKMDFGKFLYVEYEPEVKANLDKIYIAPAATQYQPYLAKLLCGTNSLGKKIKIELSNNPYRHTS